MYACLQQNSKDKHQYKAACNIVGTPRSFSNQSSLDSKRGVRLLYFRWTQLLASCSLLAFFFNANPHITSWPLIRAVASFPQKQQWRKWEEHPPTPNPTHSYITSTYAGSYQAGMVPDVFPFVCNSRKGTKGTRVKPCDPSFLALFPSGSRRTSEIQCARHCHAEQATVVWQRSQGNDLE